MASAVRRELVIQYNIGSEKLPEELAAAVSQSIAGVALQAYEDRLHSGLSTVRFSRYKQAAYAWPEQLSVPIVLLHATVTAISIEYLCVVIRKFSSLKRHKLKRHNS